MHVFGMSLGWREVLRRTISDIDRDNCLGLAAQLAFYFLLSLFPALLFLVALIGYLPIENTLTAMLEALGAVAPREVPLAAWSSCCCGSTCPASRSWSARS